jgi:hypothetical protein
MTHTVKFRLTDEDYVWLTRIARNRDMNLSEALRTLITDEVSWRTRNNPHWW